VLDQYIHFILVYFEQNGDDEPYDDFWQIFNCLLCMWRPVYVQLYCTREPQSVSWQKRKCRENIFFMYFRSDLTKLRTNNVIVMDNASYHAVRAQRISNESLRKNVFLK